MGRHRLGGGRDYKTWGRFIEARIRKHIELTQKYEEEGLSHEDASKKAYEEVIKIKKF